MGRFSVSIEEMSDKVSILDPGIYAGEIIDVAIVSREGSDFIKVDEEKRWNSKAKEMVSTGQYTVQGGFMYSVALLSEKAIAQLLQDEPRLVCFINLRFDEQHKLSLKQNIQLTQIIKLFDLDLQSLMETAEESIDWDEVVTPEEYADYPDADTMYQSVVFHKELINLLGQELRSRRVRVKVCHRPNRQNKSVMEHGIDVGVPSQPFCGLLAYAEDSENDLD
jgi:hypothetical protein